MKKILIATILTVSCFADLKSINQFEADFTQKIIDDNNKAITYKGHIEASKPQFALWKYTDPIHKNIYIQDNRIVIVEPELEQVIYKKVDTNFNFFNIINNAKKLSKNSYEAHYNEKKFLITMKNATLESITYRDDFDNLVTLYFTHVSINKTIPFSHFQPKIPADFDIIKE